MHSSVTLRCDADSLLTMVVMTRRVSVDRISDEPPANLRTKTLVERTQVFPYRRVQMKMEKISNAQATKLEHYSFDHSLGSG